MQTGSQQNVACRILRSRFQTVGLERDLGTKIEIRWCETVHVWMEH